MAVFFFFLLLFFSCCWIPNISNRSWQLIIELAVLYTLIFRLSLALSLSSSSSFPSPLVRTLSIGTVSFCLRHIRIYNIYIYDQVRLRYRVHPYHYKSAQPPVPVCTGGYYYYIQLRFIRPSISCTAVVRIIRLACSLPAPDRVNNIYLLYYIYDIKANVCARVCVCKWTTVESIALAFLKFGTHIIMMGNPIQQRCTWTPFFSILHFKEGRLR